MKHVVDRDIIDRASLCTKNHSCLNESCGGLCKVKESIDDKVLFIECVDDVICSYQKCYGDTKYCACPVRKEIFRKYRR